MGTLWQGKRAREAQAADLKTSLDATTKNLGLSLNTESERSRREEKRQVYASYMAALGDAITQKVKRISYGEEGVMPEWPLHAEYATSITAVMSELEKVKLIAPQDIAPLANRAARAIVNFDDTEEANAEHSQARDQLLKAMRADLGSTD